MILTTRIKKDIVHLYKLNNSYMTIANTLGVSNRTVAKVIIESGIKPRRKGCGKGKYNEI